MARESQLNGLDMTTRRKTSTRAFEDMKAGKREEVAKIMNPIIQERKLEKVGTGSREVKVTKEEPYFKPRLTVRARKAGRLNTGVSISDE
ncbi:hypothetical protein L0657_07625 [Dyadobacter sp. CY345]|uniref:hypothetical protein n=1 Tax=Dyadobacter sp. CY345 TaxID=2909335 RepID=UPI001F1723A2|nr:hypothetical protein [Dyadobacter sp. CY345]MCF2443822.1 hypothetical protein [Dyadobacter sp. CY345]